MPEVRFGRKDEPATTLAQTNEFIAVRTHRPIARRGPPVDGPLERVLADTALVASFPEANVGVYRLPEATAEAAESTKAMLRGMTDDVRFAGRVLVDESGEPVVYTENLFVKFIDALDDDICRAILADYHLTAKRRVDYAENAWIAAADGRGQEVFEIADRLLERGDVEFAHPEIVRRRVPKGPYPEQWHLADATIAGVAVSAHAHVGAALEIATGAGVTIAVIDDGFDIDHPEFAGRIVAPRDATLGTGDPRPKDSHPLYPENHGTACAGVACAAGSVGACGVAPDAELMPIRLSSALGSTAEADAFKWASDKGADVISCSWGPADGKWDNPHDPLHTRTWPIPASTRLAIDHAATHGRNGSGCIILFAAGNGNEDVQHDGYASYPEVIAVAACNDRGVRSCYSDYGAAVWCAFPSNDFAHAPSGRPKPLTQGIWTTDRRGHRGYNSGHASEGDAAGYFTSRFGGTSSACPGVAGVVALMLSVKPTLSRDEVSTLLRQSCDRIDPANGNYDASGRSAWYGWGRVNAERAVQLAV
ncbi:MAG: S8 family serine peptidase [Sphingomonas sp.]|uniref:S8 family peptidase n=1 Tax=Sphingomonas sp. TaxID=28214 RepID=UPI0022732A88|nr:S8 family serine peptidase [Sphingomonas sp.]MCX8476733.1 S8 family serine peptidase [Sphingomonas sp.]